MYKIVNYIYPVRYRAKNNAKLVGPNVTFKRYPQAQLKVSGEIT